MAETSFALEIPLETSGGMIVLESVEWWNPHSRFVLVRYSERGRKQELGLRLDLDKRVFLDSLENPGLDRQLNDCAAELSARVAELRERTAQGRIAAE